MPIKFRCPHCKQFLGISRSKAGAVTDCPTCGRTIRVPDLDGRISPLPKPKLDYADTGLARALSELASLGAAEAVRSDGAASPQQPKLEAVVLAPPPVIEAVALPVPLPPEPMQQVGPLELVVDPAASVRSPPGRPDSLWEPLSELAAMSPGIRSDAIPERRSKSPLILAGVACGLLGAAVGFLIGRMTVSESVVMDHTDITVPQPAPPVASPPPAIPVAEQGNAPAGPSTQPSDHQGAITGRVTYVNADGESQPDIGARILALPAAREGTSKLAVDSFRTGASDADLRVAQASIRALGGDFVLAGVEGQYNIQLPSTGTYQLLIVSKYQGRGPSGESDPAGLAVLMEWFDKPQLFLGQTLSTLTTVQFDGQNSSNLDHVFPKAE